MRQIYYLAALLLAAPVRAAGAERPAFGELLSYDLEELMNVDVVSVSKEHEHAASAPATVRVITAAEIAERGYLTLEEALSSLPGFQFRDISGFNSYVFMRGLPSQNNLIQLLVDGVQINELNSGGFYGGAQFDLAAVERIEVVYGPASALYGTNAVSGVINIITKTPAAQRGGRAGALAGQFDTRAAEFGYGWADEAAGAGAALSGAMKHTAKSGLKGPAGDGNWTRNMRNFEDDWTVGGRAEFKGFTLGALVQDKQASRATNEKSAGTRQLDFGTNWHIRFANAWLARTFDAGGGRTLDAKLYYRLSTVMDDTVAGVYDAVCSTCGQQGQYRPNDLAGLESRLKLRPAERLDLVCGFVAERENLARDFSTTYSGDPLQRPPRPRSPAMASNELLSVYTQARYDLSGALSAHAGVRYDNSSVYGVVNTPRAGLVYADGPAGVKLLYSEAFRAPKPWDYTYGAGNPGLDPERLMSYELAGSYSFGRRLLADVSLYSGTLTHYLKLDSAANRWVNSGRITAAGGEARLELAAGRFKGRLHYSYTDSRSGDGAVAEIGRHAAGGGLFYAFSRRVKLDAGARWQGRRRNPKPVAATGSDFVGAWFVTDLTLSYTAPDGFSARLLSKNLFNERYYHTSNRPPDRYRQPARQLLLQLGWAFGG